MKGEQSYKKLTKGGIQDTKKVMFWTKKGDELEE